eukprot:gene235-431_t
MEHQAAAEFQKIVNDLDFAALRAILPQDVLNQLLHFSDLVEENPDDDGIKKELFDEIAKVRLCQGEITMLDLIADDVNNVVNQDGESLLHIAAYFDDPATLKYLLQKPGINVNSVDSGGSTPLMFAENACMEMLLADPRVDVNAVNSDGKPVLHIYIGQSKDVYGDLRALLKRDDVDLNKPDSHGRSVLLYWFHTNQRGYELNILKVLLHDQRTLLSYRDPAGMSIKDYVPNLNPAKRGEVVDLIRNHEYVRLQRAKKHVKILKDWCAETAPGVEKYLPDGLLSNCVLPYVADVLSPLEEIGDITI